MSITQLKGSQILDGTIKTEDIDDGLEKEFTKVRVTTGDSSPDFLSSKVLAGDNITINVVGSSGSIQYLAISGSTGGAGTITGVTAGTGLTGGGASGTVTLSLSNTGSAGQYGSATQVPVFNTDDQGRVTAVTNTSIQIAESQVTNLVSDLSGKTSTSTTISTGTGLTGGGDLSTNRTLAIDDSIVATVSGTLFKGNVGITGSLGASSLGISGGVLYQLSGTIRQNGNIVWDATNNRLGIGVTNPARQLQVLSGFRFGNNTDYYELLTAGGGIIRWTPGGAITTLEINNPMLFPAGKTIGFTPSLGSTTIDSGFSRAGAGIISVSGSAPGAILRFNATSTPVALGDLAMNTTTGRPLMYVGGAPHAAAHVDEVALLAGAAFTGTLTQSGANVSIAGQSGGSVTIGNTGGASSLTLDAGTGNITIGSSASARSITIGNVTGASSLTLNAGSGGVSITGNMALAQGKLHNLGQATVTQQTSLSTGVTINSSSGVITTVTANVGTNSSTTFTVTNSAVSTNSVVVASLGDYSGTIGTNGHPYILVDSIASGSFSIKICNASSNNALNGTLKIKFIVA